MKRYIIIKDTVRANRNIANFKDPKHVTRARPDDCGHKDGGSMWVSRLGSWG